MSLKGINRGTAITLIDLLDQIQELEQIIGFTTSEKDHVRNLRIEIYEAYQKYESLMESIAMQVDVYQKIYTVARSKVIPQKLKTLRKMIPPDDVAYDLLNESIRKSYAV